MQDSPVFNYINSLSPIRPVRSIPNPNQFSSLNFTSPPSVFTSPHLTSSHKESRFFKTHNSSSSDPTNSVESQEDESTSHEEVPAEGEDTKGLNIDDCMREEASVETNLDDSVASPCGGNTTDLSLVPYAPTRGEDGSCEDNGMELQKMHDNVQGKTETPDWESLIADASELLIFDSPDASEAFRCFMMQRASNSEARFRNGVEKQTMQHDSNKEPESANAIPYEAVSLLHRGIRRRCLDFEMPGNKQTSSENNTAACESSSRCVVPSIGLHLNAILMSSKDCKTNVTQDYSCSANIQVGLQRSISTLQDSLDQTENEIREDADQDVPVEPALQELNLSSPKKKRVKLDSGEGESCKRCNCKKSKCLKLYCECFAAGVYCIEPCSCIDCFNKPIHEDVVLATRKQIESRNPLAFAPKVIRNSDSVQETGDDASKTPASARHKRGCNCKKSNCLKKYCECYQGGVGCSINCRCEGCKNAFGRKDGSSIDMEAEQEEENETSEKSRTAKSQQNTEVLMRKDMSSALPTTPTPIYRPELVQLPFSSSKNRMPPPQSLLGGGSSSGIFNSQYLRKPDISLSQSRIEKSFETVAVDGAEQMPEILIHSPIPNIKSVSPNGKRVSPPHMESSSSGSILGRRNGGRKLILQSIPSFPSLTPQH
ncbi:TESMIN/TSO1-like CXC 2 [Arabidopsis thaliana]|jgi:hypothetical protein|uniref:TESMIN/TSO1-like CXC 2 n=1 Tax=Arabidopsis thaliana TaxID=3702 RepID=A0A1P8B4Z6_ARATH|nr:TESMIN/TSO1-like CXC 2 [Arabidopsis thaliana]ANM66667.1 TESMIN/TSO1-like CXC 2 [Arabidopsis thaliana]|eukprot:NP_001328549.1 TESMIN/TSO1-like CXC 2 [Arabidopsis thaliana]